MAHVRRLGQLPGNKGKKKQLEVDAPEAVVVHRVFERYLYGDQGGILGCMALRLT